MNRSLLTIPSVAALALSSCASAGHKEVASPTHQAAKPGQGAHSKTVPKPVATPPVLPLSQRGTATSISLTDAFALQQSGGAVFYDARPKFYYLTGHIPGALSMPKASCEEEILVRKRELDDAVAAKKPIIVYCTNFLCGDARTVASHLALSGYSSAEMSGGWDSWKESGLPTE
jgi:rhodanese-related sulfurtransferase